MSSEVTLRDVVDDDLSIFFEQQRDPEANRMAAFTSSRDPSDREAFLAHERAIRANDANRKVTILYEGQVAGNIFSFELDGEREVGYWLGKEFWGKGIATQALAEFLKIEQTRPLYGHAAKDNLGSQRVLEKNGFVPFGEASGFSNARGKEITEVILVLHATE